MDKMLGCGGAEGAVGASGREGGCCLVWAPHGFHGCTKPIASLGKGKSFRTGRWGTYLRSDLFQIQINLSILVAEGANYTVAWELRRDMYLLCPFLFISPWLVLRLAESSKRVGWKARLPALMIPSAFRGSPKPLCQPGIPFPTFLCDIHLLQEASIQAHHLP